MRYLLGSEALRAGDYDRALAAFEADAHSYPPYFYELALCHILRDEWVAAATALRRGFAANPYIAEILGGNPNPAPLAVWHGTNLAEPEIAQDYMRMYGTLWHSQPDSFAFTRWLFNHPKVLAERAAILECQEALLWESDGGIREEIFRRNTELIDQIDDNLSTAIVTKRQERRSKVMIWPWASAPRRLPGQH